MTSYYHQFTCPILHSPPGVAEGGVGGIEATGGAEADPETIENVRKGEFMVIVVL